PSGDHEGHLSPYGLIGVSGVCPVPSAFMIDIPKPSPLLVWYTIFPWVPGKAACAKGTFAGWIRRSAPTVIEAVAQMRHRLAGELLEPISSRTAPRLERRALP